MLKLEISKNFRNGAPHSKCTFRALSQWCCKGSTRKPGLQRRVEDTDIFNLGKTSQNNKVCKGRENKWLSSSTVNRIRSNELTSQKWRYKLDSRRNSLMKNLVEHWKGLIGHRWNLPVSGLVQGELALHSSAVSMRYWLCVIQLEMKFRGATADLL